MTTPQLDISEKLAAIDLRDKPTDATLTYSTTQSHAAADAKPTLLSKETESEVPLSTLAAESGAAVVAAASAAPAAIQEIDAPLSEAVVAPVTSPEEQRAAGSSDAIPSQAVQASSSATAASASAAPALEPVAATSASSNQSDHRPTNNSGEGTWQLKEISWPDPRVGGERRTTKILVQDANGPCSLLALANILILRGSIHITPKARQVVEYSYLSALIADFLISRPSDQSSLSLESALSILPSMTQGLNIDVCFKDIWSFKGTGDAGELAIFERCGVPLVHGWVADQDGPEFAAVTQAETYDGAQMAIVAGMELQDKENKTADEIATVKNAHAIDAFVNSTATQITYAGLFSLTSSLEQGSIVAFFRNSHLGVLYRRPPAPPAESTDPNDASDALLYQLVTDSSFANEPEVAWESLVDLDGAASAFVNGDFTRSVPGGGEYAGLSAAHAARVTARRERGEVQAGAGSEDGDAALVPFPPSSSGVCGDGDGALASQRVNRLSGSGDQDGERTLSKAASALSLNGLIELSSRLARMLQAEEDQQSAQQLSDRRSDRRPSSGNNSERQRNQSNASNQGDGSRPTPSNRQSGASSSNKPSRGPVEDKKKCMIM